MGTLEKFNITEWTASYGKQNRHDASCPKNTANFVAEIYEMKF